ncbi:MAG: transporter, partial [Nocardioides sp.]|uniref:YfjP family GTPase n=1 Tax=Nocardioides sp. TaxID=35761 RepID=UPI0026066AA6
MTSLLEGAKRLVSRSSDIGARVQGLEQAVDNAEGRVDSDVVKDARAVVLRAAGRLKLSAEHTVVALAGATGSGKSSTFNALTELELSAVGVRRPTTSWATACVWGQEGGEELLEWLGIPARHQVTRDSMLSTGKEDNALQGVVLLDLPDHDSTEVSHHLEVDRLVRLADMFVWVLDPQKYADAAIHDRYLAPLASHKDVMLVVLNHIDTVPEARREGMIADVRRLLEADGLDGVPVLGISARHDWGIDELKKQIAKRVAEKKATRTRLAADVRAAAERLQAVSGTSSVRSLSKERVAALDDAFADAAGVPTVVKAVEDSTRIRANRATGWPVTAWFSKFKPDPLKRLHLDLGAAGKQLTGAARTSVPQATGVQKARVDTEVRALADQVSEDMGQPWATAI